jgi:hypothetical protein
MPRFFRGEGELLNHPTFASPHHLFWPDHPEKTTAPPLGATKRPAQKMRRALIIVRRAIS